MRCKNCGTENEEGRYICSNCGSPLYDEDEIPAQVGTASDADGAESSAASKQGSGSYDTAKDKRNTTLSIVLIVILAIVIIALIVGVVFAFSGSNDDDDESSGGFFSSLFGSDNSDEDEDLILEDEVDEAMPGLSTTDPNSVTTTNEYTTAATTKEYTTATTGQPATTATTKAPTYKVSVGVSGKGSTTGNGSYESGSKATLTATPNSGYEFDGWYDSSTGELLASGSTYSLTVTGDRNIIAKFTKVTTTQAATAATETTTSALEVEEYYEDGE